MITLYTETFRGDVLTLSVSLLSRGLYRDSDTVGNDSSEGSNYNLSSLGNIIEHTSLKQSANYVIFYNTLKECEVMLCTNLLN